MQIASQVEGSEMTDLQDLAIAAHGGLERWSGFTSASVHPRVYAIDADGPVNRGLMLVSIDLDRIAFASAPVPSSPISPARG
jgi:hypothetical protein